MFFREPWQMYIDGRRRVADVSCAGERARPAWLALTPSTASELVCVGKIKSNGVSQSLYIDRSEWPPKTSQYGGNQHPRPHQTRAAAVVAAAAVAAASAPKVIRISPVVYPQRSHTVIRRATTSAHEYYQSRLQKNNDEVNGRQKTACTNEVPVIEVVPSVMQQYAADAAVSASRPTSKRTFEQINDHDPRHQQYLRLQLRSAATDTGMKAARIADNADAVRAPSTTKSAVIPGSSVMLSCSAFQGGTADGARHHLRPLLPRGMDAPSAACAVTNVITIVPNQSLCLQRNASSNESLSSTTSSALSPMAACCETANVCRPISSPTCATGTDRSSSQTAVPVEGRAIATDRHEAVLSGSQLLHRIRLIESADQSAPVSAPPPPQPFRINYIVPLSAGAEDKPPTQSSISDESDGDEQPPPQMLEALKLVRSTPRRDVIVTSSSSANQHSASAAAAAAATRLVTMKLVNRCAH